MAKAYRYKANGKYLRNTLFYTTNSDFLGAHHGVETDAIYDPVLAAEEEAMQIESHKQDFSVAFGIPADQIECEVIPWDGVAPLPAEDEPDAIECIPAEKREGYVPVPPVQATREERIAAALEAAPLDDTLKAALAGVIGALRDE